MEKLKDRWGITSNIQIVLIFIVFAINGSFAAWVAEPVMSLLGIYKTSISVYIYWPIRDNNYFSYIPINTSFSWFLIWSI